MATIKDMKPWMTPTKFERERFKLVKKDGEFFIGYNGDLLMSLHTTDKKEAEEMFGLRVDKVIENINRG